MGYLVLKMQSGLTGADGFARKTFWNKQNAMGKIDG
jgi:hypothetical protein